MPSLSGIGRAVFCLLLLWKGAAAPGEEVQCSAAGPVGPLHPVQGLLETFEAGPGCAARQHGNKETHVIAVGRATNSPENKVTVLLKPLSLSPSPLRALHLLLTSKLPVSWWLEAERLPRNLPVLVQVSSNSSVQSHTLRLHVLTVHVLPFRPRALHRWALKHYGSLSSLTHTTHGNRVYIRVGEDPTLPAVCQLQSMFLSHNYLTSDLKSQEVQGCVHSPAGGIIPEIHVIKLHSVGSGLCGSLQVEVIVSLVPPAANSKAQKAVLILSSSVPVNWAIVAHRVRGHIAIHSSNSLSPPYPPEPGLTVSSTVNSELSSIADLLAWTSENGYTKVTSYTEADLANRFVIQLAGGGTDMLVVMNPPVLGPPWAEQRRLRHWLNGGGSDGKGRESFTVQCEDGRLSVTVDQHILQTLSVPVAAVTLQDPTCQAQSNGSHFLLVFPVISCGTEGLLLGKHRGVQYKNMMLLWREGPQTVLALNETERKSKSPLGIHVRHLCVCVCVSVCLTGTVTIIISAIFLYAKMKRFSSQFSCMVEEPSLLAPTADNVDEVNTPQPGRVPWAPGDPGHIPGLSNLPTSRHRSGPVFTLRLFVTENYEQRRIGPCVVTAGHRVYVEISATGPLTDVVDVKSCVVSPLSDPKKSPFWPVISEGCSSDPSLTLSTKTKDGEDEEDESDSDSEPEEDETEEMENGKIYHKVGDVLVKHKVLRRRMEKNNTSTQATEEIKLFRFSFVLQSVYNDSVQFLHCSLGMCVSESSRGKPVKDGASDNCQGRLRVPPLVSISPKHQCEIRNLTRPMVVTQSISSLAHNLPRPPAGQRTKRLSVAPLASPDPNETGLVMQTGPVLGIVFAAFMMGVSLMGGLWCIYNYTAYPTLHGGEGHLTDQTRGGYRTWNPLPQSDQSSSSV
ncbi:transforming growth factor beta receptor type 3 isoform X2 [Echeneis naucrates]|uniref:transforming growth factor beta receptor type 3 isoform X2 n=1 Tax=Echeneis naucrates TaxID=173247 RepID=UPI001113DE27|nr:transforming growth factor beta receptor type 3-like isoform X2 [Echeneis naucrates]